MTKIISLIFILCLSWQSYSQEKLDHGLANEFGFYHFKNDRMYKEFIDNAYKDRSQLSISFLTVYVKKNGFFSKKKMAVIGTDNWILNSRYKGIPVSKIPTVIKLSKKEFKNLRFYIVDEAIYRFINKMDRKMFYDKYIYPGSNILIRELDVKTKHAVMNRLIQEGIVLYQNELSGDIELPQQEYYWRSPFEGEDN
ncbi:hypothetical protein [Sphingobacterium sp. UGAL515B_05]|uniref:hypothetical protein n=1 Tax=Sphingobacterium sp. UGAL515B_05 TaxID=2986767 RepID=UPI00295443DC|nr:hypothetical protein [Sphingobacterium sp. UGAL515B_05]WON93780.1 hypothetical protein OK025_21340 [Sphingobacterium sp. UGAL515B_05]